MRIKLNTIEVYNINKDLKMIRTISNNINRGCLSLNQDNTILFFVDNVGYVYGCNINKDYDIIFKR